MSQLKRRVFPGKIDRSLYCAYKSPANLCRQGDNPCTCVNRSLMSGCLISLFETLGHSHQLIPGMYWRSVLPVLCFLTRFLPSSAPQVVSEHVLGAIDEVDDFVRAFVEKRKSTDYLSIGGTNLRRFSLEDIALYKETFKQVQYSSSTMRRPTYRSFGKTSACVSSLAKTFGGILQYSIIHTARCVLSAWPKILTYRSIHVPQHCSRTLRSPTPKL